MTIAVVDRLLQNPSGSERRTELENYRQKLAETLRETDTSQNQ